MNECCETCMHGEDTDDGEEVRCGIDNEVYDKSYKCGLFNHILN